MGGSRRETSRPRAVAGAADVTRHGGAADTGNRPEAEGRRVIRDLWWLLWTWVFPTIGLVTVLFSVAGLIVYGLMAAAVAETERRR